MYNIPFQTINWDSIPKTEHKGEMGIAYQQTLLLDGIKIRIVEYTKGYLADHWCQKGHIVHCLEGEFMNELENGSSQIITQGMSYIVSNHLSSHRSSTTTGTKLLIIDGDFLSAG